jgi:ABC-type sugar transport system substrate-binding protein
MRKAKLRIVKLLAVAISFTMVGCSMSAPGGASDAASSKAPDPSSAPAATSSAAATGKTKVGFVVQDETINYFLNVIKGIKDHQDKYDIECQVVDGQSDAGKQVTGVENLIANGAKCIVVCPVSPGALTDAVKESQNAGIPVVSWSEFITGSNSWLTLDQYNYGYQNGTIAGKWIASNFKNQADAHVMFIYVHGNEQLEKRGKGMMDAVAKFAPNATIVSSDQSGNTTAAGQTAVETALQRDPKLNVIVCCNDTVAMGANEAMKAAGKSSADVCITGCDADTENLKDISAGGLIKGSVDIGSYNQGEKFLEIVQKTIEVGAKGKLEKPVYVDFTAVTKDNVSQYLK